MRVILFNLFPYRDRQVQRRSVRVATELSVGVFLALGVAMLVWADFEERLNRQAQYMTELATMEDEIAARVARVQTMKDEARRLRRQVTALESVEKESLQSSQVLSYLDKTLPRTVALSKMSLKDSVLVINGLAESVPQLAKWVEGMEGNSGLFKRVDFVFLKDTADANNRATSKTPSNEGPHQFEIKLGLTGLDQPSPPVELANAATR